MDNDDFFHNRQPIFESSFRNKPQGTNATLNPWSQHQLVNPYLNTKSHAKSKGELKKVSQRKKVLSLDNAKNTKFLVSLGSKELPEPSKIPRELPKLNIDKLIREDQNKKRNTINDPSYKYQLNSSPLYFSSPTLKKMNPLNFSSQNNKKPKIFPSVSRELNITRKIYLLENKMNSHQTSPMKRSSYRQYTIKEEGGDIRRLVEKEWAKKS